MSELAKKLPESDTTAWGGNGEVYAQPPTEVDLEGGNYRDPDPNVVNWINQKFIDPQENIEANIIKAFEFAGVVKPLKDTLRPLEYTGLMPKGKTTVYAGVSQQRSPFMDRREEQLLDEFVSDDLARNQLLLGVKRLTASRFSYDEREIEELWAWGKEATKSAREMPPALRELTVMLGIRPPENPANAPSVAPPPLTRDLAPDIYLMMLRESKQTQ